MDGRLVAELKLRRQRALAGQGAEFSLRSGSAAWTLGSARGILPGLALGAVLITLAIWWVAQQSITPDNGELDMLLLTDDLPPNAYADKDFPAWRRLPGLCRS